MIDSFFLFLSCLLVGTEHQMIDSCELEGLQCIALADCLFIQWTHTFIHLIDSYFYIEVSFPNDCDLNVHNMPAYSKKIVITKFQWYLTIWPYFIRHWWCRRMKRVKQKFCGNNTVGLLILFVWKFAVFRCDGIHFICAIKSLYGIMFVHANK